MRNFKIFHLERVPGLGFFEKYMVFVKTLSIFDRFLNVFVTKSVGNRFHELSLRRHDRLGLGTSKIEVLAKKTRKTREKQRFSDSGLWPGPGGRAKRKELTENMKWTPYCLPQGGTPLG